MTDGLEIKVEDHFHLVHASCKGGDKPLNLNIALGNNIGRHNPSSISKQIRNLKLEQLPMFAQSC